jgi:hypothetical protein
MNQLETTAPQPNVIVVGPNGGGGFFSRLLGAIIASCFISGIGYLGVYGTLAARAVLHRQGAIVVMPDEPKPKAGIVARGQGALGGAIVKLREELDKLKNNTAGGFEKARDAGANVGKTIERKVDKATDQMKVMLAHRREEAKKKAEEKARQLAIEKAEYEEQVAKFLAHYDGQCPNPRCHAPLRTKGNSSTKYVGCARCGSRFTAGRARALGTPSPPPFRSGNQSIFARLFGAR